MKSEMSKCEKCPHASRTLVGNDLWDFKCKLGGSPKSCKKENDMKQETLELLDLAQEFNVKNEEWGAYCIMLKEGFLGAYIFPDGKVEYFTFNMEGGETHLDVEKFDKLRKFVSLFKGE